MPVRLTLTFTCPRTPATRRRTLATAAALVALSPLFVTGAVQAQAPAQPLAYPTKPVTLVVPNPPGGVVDTSARLLGEPLGKLLGQAVVIENKGGASGNIAYQQVALAPKDGYTLLISYSAYHLPYKGSGPAIQDVLGGQVQVFMTTPPSVMQHVQVNKLKAYAVTGKVRHPGLPNVPTTAEAGLPGFELEAWVGLFAPAGTLPAVVQALTDKVKAALATPEARAVADRTGIEIRYLGPEALGALVQRETTYWGQVIKAKGIQAD